MHTVTKNTIEYEIDPRDVKVQLFKLMLPVRIRYGMGASAAVGLVLLGVGKSPWIGSFLLLLPLVFVVVYYRVIAAIVSEHPELLEPQTLTFDEQGLQIVNGVTQVSWPWARVKSLVDSGEFLLLRVDSMGSGAVIPKKALSSEQIKSLRSLSKGSA